MERRTILRRAGALGALALAGCVAGDDGQGDGPTTDDPTATPTPSPSPSPSPTPTTDPVGIVDRAISTTHTGCQSGDDQFRAAVSMDEAAGSVTVTGTLNTPNPCHEATLSSVSWDADAGRLAIDVAAVPTGEPCVECVGAVEYRATVTMNAGLPDSVAITHDGTPVPTGSTSGGTSESDGGSDATPRLVSSDLTVLGIDPERDGQAGDIEFRHDALDVVVTGTVRARNGCERPELGSVAYDPTADELSVDVLATAPPDAEDKACTQAISYIDYRATFHFENALPKTVSVSQDGTGGMAASHSSASESAAPEEE